MTRVLGMTDRAHEQFNAAYEWWKENRSEAQAIKWYNRFAYAMSALVLQPEKCPLAHENVLFPYEIREFRCGLSKRKTHRAVFTIRPDMVLIVAVRHLAQQAIQPEDYQ